VNCDLRFLFWLHAIFVFCSSSFRESNPILPCLQHCLEINGVLLGVLAHCRDVVSATVAQSLPNLALQISTARPLGGTSPSLAFFANTERPESFILALTDRARLLPLDLPRGYTSESRRLIRLKPGETILSYLKIAQNRRIVIESE
jgi:hypothetical protein